MLTEICLCLAACVWARPPVPGGALQESTPAPDADPVVGVWKGRVIGKGAILPEAGALLSLWLRRSDDSSVVGQVGLQGFDAMEVSGSFDAATRMLVVKGSFNAIPVNLSAKLESDQLQGSLSGMGMNFPAEATRISHEILEAPPKSAVSELDTLSADEWVEDLRFLGTYLPQVHLNAFHTTSADDWKALIASLETRLPELDAEHSTVALAQLVARVGDAHTELSWREPPAWTMFPIRFQVFSDGLYVTQVDERWGDALGARVLKVGTESAQAALDAVSTLFSSTSSWRKAKAPSLLPIARLLAVLDLLSSPDELLIVVEPTPGESLELALDATGDGSWLRLPDPAYEKVPRWMTRRGENYWYEPLDDGRTLYFAYNRCAEDPRRPMTDFIDELLAAVESESAERLVVDLRNNSGGNSSILGQHIERIGEHPQLNAPGRLVGLIGPVTYSSGMSNAYELRADAGATLVGEPTGGRLNAFGEMRSFRLPNSGLQVFYSTKYFQNAEVTTATVEPDVRVETSSEDYFLARDPVLERALELPVEPLPEGH